MSILKWLGLGAGGLLLLGAIVILLSLYYLSRNQPPASELSLGVSQGELKPCPDTPNCVSTQAPQGDQTHYVEPIPYQMSRTKMRRDILNWIESQPKTEVITNEESYIHAVFASSLFGFKDDLEIYLPPGDGVVHLRSAARVGQGDMGVNRERYERLRAALE